ncbi:translation initiation factor IF-1 [Patescibacteria group bacterium]|nr:translation initiation factor IF-1 [Patescibacteria group bacterium]
MAKHVSSWDKSKKQDQTSTIASEATKKKKANVIEVEGIVLETLPDAKFKIKLDNGQEILGHVSGKMRMYLIKVLPGDRVIMEMTPYDLTKGRITKRC